MIALTWKDIRKLVILMDEVCDEKGTHHHLNGANIREHCEEVLKRFYQSKKK